MKAAFLGITFQRVASGGDGFGRPPLELRGFLMVSHRRAGVVARALRLCRAPEAAITAPRRAGIELVDARTRVAHRVSPDELRTGRHRGDYQALCGARLLAASLTDPGHRPCPECAS